MTYQELYENIIRRRSYLCVGLDTDPVRIPKHLLKYDNPVLEFNRQIIEATAPYCVAYKPNTAFYEAAGASGWETLQQTMQYISQDHFTIADAKRGDIGNTSKLYARAFFERMNFDSITVAPYMGADSVQPFLDFADKWVILLALTSNSGSQDFQVLKYEGERLYEKVIKTAQQWGGEDQLMFVVGATQTAELKHIREIAPKNFLLVPGVGAQGGSLEEVSRYGMNSHCGLLVNASRSILYASEGEDFAEAAEKEAQKLQAKMSDYLDKYLPEKR